MSQTVVTGIVLVIGVVIWGYSIIMPRDWRISELVPENRTGD
jgi:hypothetical protein